MVRGRRAAGLRRARGGRAIAAAADGRQALAHRPRSTYSPGDRWAQSRSSPAMPPVVSRPVVPGGLRKTRFAGSKVASNHRQRVAIGGTSRVCHGGVMRLWVRSGTLTVALILTLTVAACGADASTTGGKPSPPPSRATRMPTSSARTAVLATPSFHLKRIATGLIQPLYVTAPPGDTHRLFIVEKTGEIVILRDGVRLAAPFLNISNLVSQASEQGLLCLAFDPHFAANHRLYVSYTDLSNNAVSYTHLRAHETRHDLVCRLL